MESQVQQEQSSANLSQTRPNRLITREIAFANSCDWPGWRSWHDDFESGEDPSLTDIQGASLCAHRAQPPHGLFVDVII